MSDKILERYLTPRRGDDERVTRERSAGALSDVLEADAADNLGCFGWLRGVRERALMLELRKKDGLILAISYACLERAEYDPAVGITLHVLGRAIRIKGRGLNGKRCQPKARSVTPDVPASTPGDDLASSRRPPMPSSTSAMLMEGIAPGHSGLFHGITRHRIPWIEESNRGDRFDGDQPVVDKVEW